MIKHYKLQMPTFYCYRKVLYVNMQLEYLQTCPLSQLILQGYEDTRKVCRKGDIHGRVTEGHMPRNEMCNYWMQEGHMYGRKKQKDMCPFSYSGYSSMLPILLVY